nr:hypothetical transcript [Hymenolepis microstoma]
MRVLALLPIFILLSAAQGSAENRPSKTQPSRKDFSRTLKNYIKEFAEGIDRFMDNDELGADVLETGKKLLNTAKLVVERIEIGLGRLVKRFLQKAEIDERNFPKNRQL